MKIARDRQAVNPPRPAFSGCRAGRSRFPGRLDVFAYFVLPEKSSMSSCPAIENVLPVLGVEVHVPQVDHSDAAVVERPEMVIEV